MNCNDCTCTYESCSCKIEGSTCAYEQFHEKINKEQEVLFSIKDETYNTDDHSTDNRYSDKMVIESSEEGGNICDKINMLRDEVISNSYGDKSNILGVELLQHIERKPGLLSTMMCNDYNLRSYEIELFLKFTSELTIKEMTKLESYEDKAKLLFDFISVFSKDYADFLKSSHFIDSKEKQKEYIDSIINSGYISMPYAKKFNDIDDTYKTFKELFDKFDYINSMPNYGLNGTLINKVKRIVNRE